MPIIEGLFAREILDSRGLPTIECTIWLDTGGIVASSVPSGTSIGKNEALELRDNDPERMMGKGVLTAVNNLNTIIAPKLKGLDPTKQSEIDTMLRELDGTPNKTKLGANALIAASQTVMKAGALTAGVPLYFYILQTFQLTKRLDIPTCIYSIVNGGHHGAQNLDLQEFQIIPATHMTFANSLNLAVTIFQKLEEVLALKGAIHSVGILGGFAPNLYSNTDVFEILIETIKTTQYTFAQDVFFGIDAAASHIFHDGKYLLKDKAQGYSTKELLEYYKKLRSLYHVFYLEDPFRDDDPKAWTELVSAIGETSRIIGDDVLVSNKVRLQEAINQKLCNTALVKPNQIGTITETIEFIHTAKQAGWQVIVSHRSGETNDDFIADFAVGVGADFCKFGPPNRGERVAKYNRLLQIEEEILFYHQQHAQNQSAPEAGVATLPNAHTGV